MKKSLPLRLYAGLAFAIIIVLTVVIFTILAIQKQEEGTKMVTHSITVIEKVRDIRYNLLQMRGGRRAYWFTNKESFLDYFYNGNSIIPPSIQELKQYVSDNPIQAINMQRLDSSLSDLFNFWGNRGKVLPGYSKEKMTEITSEEEQLMANIYTLFETIKAEENRLLFIRENTLAQDNIQTKELIIGGVIFLMLVVLILVNAVITTLKSRIRAGNKLHAGLAEMEKLNAGAEEKNWVLTGVATITSEIQSVDGKNDLNSDIIRSVVNYMQVPAGAIYIADEDGKILTMAGAVAVSRSANIVFESGVGIVGNAALKREISIIRDIPSDYWKIESGTGTMSGKGEIACIPLWVAENLKAVVELGSLNEFSKKQRMLMDTISTALATAIHTRQSRVKISTLLSRVQEQQEAMLSQQEELKKTNEELSKQTEELQASEEELKTQEEELRQINAELHERNDTVENAKQALIIKAQELEATSKFKSEFLANMSHELRTPLNSVLILAKLLADNNLNNLQPKQIEYAKIIHKSGSDLLQLINDILDLSKIESGKVELLVEEVSIDSIATDISQLFNVVASEKDIHFETQLGEKIPKSIHSDKQRIEQVLKNLLSNAFKFTPKGGSVTIAFENRDQFDRKRIGISVTDSGIGIPEAKQKLIFEAFQQADGSTSRQYGGTGLGLSISKELVRLLGGEIEVASLEGRGSTFTILLPHELKVEKIVINDREAILPKVSTENITEQQKVEDDRKLLTGENKTMLIIEDDESFATILKDFARDKGYKVIVALKGDEGLYYARQYRPDAIILDIQLPVIDGWSLLNILKADDLLKNIPVHIISAFDDSRLHTAGALAYVKKPIDREGLEHAFRTIDIYLSEHLRKVLIISASHFKDESLKQLFRKKHHDILFEQVATVEAAKEKMKTEKYACLIADIGNKVADGVKSLQHIQKELHDHSIPVIIYLDTDISPTDELQLKKISDVIVRDSPSVNNRLRDELELFLFKVQETDQRQEQKNNPAGLDDTILAGKKILVVDDDMRNVFALTNALEMHQMEVITAADGKESIRILEATPAIDIVLMDIMMPEMDGYEAIKKIKEGPMRQVPIIAVTAKAMAGDREKCIAAGASDYITKPVDLHKLLSLMRVWITQK